MQEDIKNETKNAQLQRVKNILLEQYNSNVSAMARAINCEQATLNNYIIGRRNLSLDLINAILTNTELSAEWLMRGVGSMKVSLGQRIVNSIKGCGSNTDIFNEIETDEAQQWKAKYESLEREKAQWLKDKEKIEKEKDRLMTIVEHLTSK